MALFDFLFKAKPQRKASDEPKPQGIGYAAQRKPLVQYENTIAASAAMEHPIVFRCLHKIASSVQTVDWYAEADPDVLSGERSGATAIKSMNALLASPNDSYSSSQLRYWMALNYALFGRVPFKVGIGVEQQPNGIYPLAVRHVTSQTDARGRLISYVYGFGESEEKLPVRGKNNGKSYVHEIFTPNIEGTLDMRCNVTTLRSIGLPSSIMTLLMQRAADTASGHPNSKYIVTAEKTLTDPQIDALREHIEDSAPGGGESGNILFLHNTKIEVHKLDNDLSDIHSKMPSDDMARLIFGAFGIPIALGGIGAADSAKFTGNYAESRASFWEDTLIPSYLSPIEVGLTAALCPYGMRIRFDRDSIPALGYSRVVRAKTVEQVNFLTDDEKRELAGYAPLTEAQRVEILANRKSATPVANGATPNG